MNLTHNIQRTVSTEQPLETRLEEFPPVRKLGTCPRFTWLLSSFQWGRHPVPYSSTTIGQILFALRIQLTFQGCQVDSISRGFLDKVTPPFPPLPCPLLGFLPPNMDKYCPCIRPIHTHRTVSLYISQIKTEQICSRSSLWTETSYARFLPGAQF